MSSKFDEIGLHIYDQTIGQCWIELISKILSKGEKSYDEGRGRLALSNVRIKSASQKLPDRIISMYGDRKNAQSMIDFTFDKEEISDIDIKKSFTVSAKSYYRRIKDGDMINFVVERLSQIPESKKAVMVFPTHEDCRTIMKNHRNDYLPCLVSVQFRLVNEKILNTTFFARSMDVYQKGHGNLLSMVLLSGIIAKKISQKTGWKIKLGFLDGLIVDGHIYEEMINSAKLTVQKYEKDLG